MSVAVGRTARSWLRSRKPSREPVLRGGVGLHGVSLECSSVKSNGTAAVWTARFLPGPCSPIGGGDVKALRRLGSPGRGFQPGGVEEGGLPCVESGPPGLRAALSQRCPGERKTDGALSRLGGRALALARAASSRLPVWPGSTRATRARRPAILLLPMASPGFVARSQVLSGPNVRASATCKACNGGPP